MADIKISELAETTDLEGLYTIGTDKNNLSKKVALEFVKDAANYANAQGDYAKEVADNVAGNTGVSDYPTFSASTAYAAGDVVIYSGRLYRFTTAHAAGSWNGNDVVATSINAEAENKLAGLDARTKIVICDSAASEPIKDIYLPIEGILSREQLQRTRLMIIFTYGNSVYGNSLKLRINKEDSMTYPLYYGNEIITAENNLQESPFMQELFFSFFGDALVYPLLSFASNMNDKSDKAVPLKLLKESESGIRDDVQTNKNAIDSIDARTIFVICDSAASEPIKDISLPIEGVLSREQLQRTRLTIMFTYGNSVYGNSLKLRINKEDSMTYPLYYGNEIITAENNLQESPFMQELFFSFFGDALVYPLLSFASNMNDKPDKAVPLKLLKESESGIDARTKIVTCDSAASEPIKDIYLPIEGVLSLEQLQRTHLMIVFTYGNSVYGNSLKLRINKEDSMTYPLYYGNEIITAENNLQESPFMQQLFFSAFGDALVYPLLSFASNMNDRSDKAVPLKLLKESESGIKESEKDIKKAISIPYSIIKTEGVVHYADGEIEFAQYGCYPTDYINIEGNGEKLLLTQIAVTHGSDAAGIAWYDSEKNFISGQMAETNASVIGYKEIEVSVPDGACFLRMNKWKDDLYEGAATDAFYVIGTNQLHNLRANEKGGIMIHPTTWLSTARNYILKEENIDGVPYYMFSNDLGKTWNQLQNTIGDTMFVHWFADGSCMICSPTKAYWVDNTYSQINESIVYDYDGSVFVGNSRHFKTVFCYDSPLYLISNKETAIWCDYGGPSGYIGRIWMTQDNGKTLRCICKDKETKLTNGSTMQVRHFHNTAWDEWEECLWLTTGDLPDECMVLAGKQNEDGSWSWDVKVTGSTFKFGQIEVDKNYLYFVADYTTGEPTGILKVVKSQVANPNAYSYIFKDAASTPYSGYMSDSAGHRLLTPDGIGYNKIYYAHGDFKFSEIPISFSDGKRLSFGWIQGWNYNGDIIIRACTGYDITDMKLNGYMYNLSDAMRKAGYEGFGKMMQFL